MSPSLLQGLHPQHILSSMAGLWPKSTFSGSLSVFLLRFCKGLLMKAPMWMTCLISRKQSCSTLRRETSKRSRRSERADQRSYPADGGGQQRADSLIGIPSGFTNSTGWRTDGRIPTWWSLRPPFNGKTAFVLTMARNVAVEHNRAVAFFSLEMASMQLVNRLIVAETELPSNRIRMVNWLILNGNSLITN